MINPTPRWYSRFDNFQRAFILLRQAHEQGEPLTQLEMEGFIRRFRYTMNLAWKTMKDYLESENVVLDQVSPRTVIRQAFEAGIVQQGETLQKALDACNRMSHTYSFETFKRVIADIRSDYLDAFEELHEFLLVRRVDGL